MLLKVILDLFVFSKLYSSYSMRAIIIATYIFHMTALKELHIHQCKAGIEEMDDLT